MKVSGFSFIRNAVKYDYPVVEAISSVLPLCDEFILMLGNSEDDTEKLIESISSAKVKVFKSTWDDSLREGGKVLAVETNKALDQVAPDSDWCFYIQGDEVLHEQFLVPVKQAMKEWKDNPEVEGLLFDYMHFYGSYDYIGDSSRWYRREVRIVRNDPSIRSYKDAQGFRKGDRPLNVKKANACIYHYGWVKPPQYQQEKQKYFHKLWHSDDWVKRNVSPSDEFDYSGIDSLSRFEGEHPEVMLNRIKSQNWKFDFDPSRKNLGMKALFKTKVEKLTGWRPGEYKNYRLI
ncbi:MAG: glycosyltransferase family 2 protein [Bacteroidetes bacterium]|nr:MAG: glycosyltransferase family 2 protein [Bacteroidota bacterium]REK06653.1 MAG: glycosyltransferase family 2 protein [Bacteroidota bacterium]REK33419.1 MAG: glycosyltransferase family 2 protein [Bacteroidota bacterium]REK49818.1 MAG: glycosyltransferase family 2 protein [Bacteroidota bacterium]